MGSRLTVGLLFTATRRVDENEARVPPPPATPLQFPSCHPQEQSSTWLDQLDVVKLFKDLFAPGAQLKHLEALGIIHTNNIRLERILPDDYLPPNSWFEDDALTEDYESSDPPPRKQVLSNGRAAPNRKDFYDLIKELSHDNGDAFRAARRQPAPPGRQAPKIVHSRKVWNGLADMAEYWDVSLDRYLEDNDQKDSDAMDVDELGTGIQESRGENPEETKKKTYMGRRTNTSSKMPKAFREDTVYGFIEMVVWAFGCTLENPTTLQSQKLLIQNIFFTLPYFKSVHRMPEDRRKARAGIKEGPLVGVFCRNQTQFLNADESEGSGKGEIFDLLKESGILTLIAQKRAREGKEPDNPGAGKWWATAPRWGGGKGGEFGGADDEPVEDPSAAPGNGPQPRKRTKRASQEEMWRAMRPPPSLWEKGIEYHCIGKGKGNDYDDVSENPIPPRHLAHFPLSSKPGVH